MSSVCLKALELNQLASKILLYSRYLVNYDATTSRFYAETSHWRLKSLYFTWIFLSFILWPLATFYIVIYQGVFHPDRVTYDRLFFSIIVSAPGILCNGLNYGLLRNNVVIANYLNLLLDLSDKCLYRAGKKGTKKGLLKLLQLEWNKLKNKSTRNEIDFVGLLMIGAVFFFSICPIFYIPGPFLTRADPFSYPVQVITGYDDFPLYLYIPFRYIPAVGAVICTMESARAVRTVFLTLVITAKVTVNLLQRIQRISKTDVSTAIEQYALTYAVYVKSMTPASLLLFLAVEGGVFIAVISLTGTFVGWRILNPWLYWLNPLMASLTILIVSTAMPCAAYSAELSLSLVKKWMFRVDECRRGDRGYNVRMLRSFQPMAFYMNGKGYLLRESKTNMFETIIMNTVDTILMVMDLIN